MEEQPVFGSFTGWLALGCGCVGLTLALGLFAGLLLLGWSNAG